MLKLLLRNNKCHYYIAQKQRSCRTYSHKHRYQPYYGRINTHIIGYARAHTEKSFFRPRTAKPFLLSYIHLISLYATMPFVLFKALQKSYLFTVTRKLRLRRLQKERLILKQGVRCHSRKCLRTYRALAYFCVSVFI